MPHPPRKGTSLGAPPSGVLVELVDRLEAQAEELGRLKAITAVSETVSGQERERAERLENEVIELRAKLAQHQARPRRWWQPHRHPLTGPSSAGLA